MKVSTDLKAGGYLDNAAQEAGKAWGNVTNFVAKAEAGAKTDTTDAINTTATFTNLLADTASKF